jgi:hypothetical protein
MRIAIALAAFALAGVSALPALAQAPARAPDPVPIEDWPLAKISAMGDAIYRQDRASWVSTDALLAHLGGRQPVAGMAGWIVVDEGAVQRVRYVRDDAGVVKAAYDIEVRDGRAGRVVEVDEALPEVQAAQFRARITAAQNIGRLRCSQQLNAVVLDDPDSDGWLVWLLTSTADANIIPMGGHYRFHISADGQTMIRRDMLSNSCLNMPRQPEGPQGQPAALVVSQIVSDAPVETHVFLSLQSRLPIYVAAGKTLYEVNGKTIRTVER